MNNIIIIGAGPSGLCAAKTFLQDNPAADIVLLDAHATLGGVWAREQLYPTLRTNNLAPAVDFTDLAMDESHGVRQGEHVSGESMHRYLCAYAERFDLVRRIRLRTKVARVQRQEKSGWCVHLVTDDKTDVLFCGKLVVATGILSVPHMPGLKGAANFEAPLLHSSELGPKGGEVLSSPAVETIAVLGGGKSAYDAVYLAATTGHKVEWIIRKSGRGPAWVFPTHTFLGPARAWRERLATRRIVTFMSPSMIPDHSGFGWLRGFLYRSHLGKSISHSFWEKNRHGIIRDCGYRTDERLRVLEPEQAPFWYGTASGTLNYETDFFSFILSGQVRIHREDVSHLSPQTVHLADGNELAVDALVACTGFSAKPTINFEPANLHAGLGIPSADFDEEQSRFWSALDTEANHLIASRLPQLVDGPLTTHIPSNATSEETYTPWRLYRGIAPPGLAANGDRSLVFLGMCSNLANMLRLEVQCLWALAYFKGRLPSVDRDVVQGRIYEETAQFQRFAHYRAPYGHGRAYPDLVFEQLPYWDMLLTDLGLPTRRKANGFKELFEPYTQEDYRGLVEEWLEMQRKGNMQQVNGM